MTPESVHAGSGTRGTQGRPVHPFGVPQVCTLAGGWRQLVAGVGHAILTPQALVERGSRDSLHLQVSQWKVVTEHNVTRTFTFPDFRMALDFVNRVGEVAEQQGHHPDILLAWGKAEVTLWTHKSDGLTESDFIMAAKIDGLYPGSASTQ